MHPNVLHFYVLSKEIQGLHYRLGSDKEILNVEILGFMK